ncbi:serine/arginine repetitive matrix protein 1-like [Eschrichtius robustus]|uniref:serine/arginine repetitive matrix protein 1-like n=1 Tax=Eschrichtius robustus TaxID=9764 RepID=UPI0035C0D3A2
MLSVRRPRARRRKRRRPLHWAPVSPPRRSGRKNQQRTAKTEEEALAAAAAASNMADTSRTAQLGDPRRPPARPLATGPRRPGPPRGTIERARARASPPGGPGHLGSRGVPCPSPAPHLLAAAGASAAASCSALGATAKHCSKKNPNVPPASLGNNIRFRCFHVAWPLYTRFSCFSELYWTLA